jgi:hypothetical protein
MSAGRRAMAAVSESPLWARPFSSAWGHKRSADPIMQTVTI